MIKNKSIYHIVNSKAMKNLMPPEAIYSRDQAVKESFTIKNIIFAQLRNIVFLLLNQIGVLSISNKPPYPIKILLKWEENT